MSRIIAFYKKVMYNTCGDSMFAKVNSMGLYGIDAYTIEVEADISSGLPGFDIVGLPDAAVKESRDRVRAAIKNAGYKFPLGKIIVNLAPADVRKEGSIYDLPIMLAILSASGQIKADVSKSIFIGEVSLDGKLRRVNGILAMAIKAAQSGFENFYMPLENAGEGAYIDAIKSFGIDTAESLLKHLKNEIEIKPAIKPQSAKNSATFELDFSEVRGQAVAKRALEVAAAGGHNILLIGPPGSGKSMLAKRFPTILPEMTFEESLNTTKIHSIAGVLNPESPMVTVRPFRSPHHTVSAAGLTGGGAMPKPGEISLAHNGVLFLDELPEFNRDVMEAMRQPLEDGKITISRAAASFTYPADFTLIAAMNPCPCGYFGHPAHKCTCTAKNVSKYLGKISGPLLDRLDLHIEVPPVEYNALCSNDVEESSEVIRSRVNVARKIQTERYKGTGITCNARLTPTLLKKYCVLTPDASALLKTSFDTLGLSARAYDRLLKVARTIADLEGKQNIEVPHVAQAIQFRSLDRKYWGE